MKIINLYSPPQEHRRRSILSSMYRPPVDMLFQGRTFEDLKSTSWTQNQWLLVNLLRSKTEFAFSHTLLNRDFWSDDTVSEAVMSSFVLWQVYDESTEGKKISDLYEIDSAEPELLVIDPFNGQNIGMWSGVIDPQNFLEDMTWFLEARPHDRIDDDGNVWQGHWEDFSDLTEEPKEDCDKSLVCTVCIWFPYGRTKRRRFLKKEPFKLLWSFCYYLLEESKTQYNAFKLVLETPGGDSETLHCVHYATFEESGLDHSLISLLLK